MGEEERGREKEGARGRERERERGREGRGGREGEGVRGKERGSEREAIASESPPARPPHVPPSTSLPYIPGYAPPKAGDRVQARKKEKEKRGKVEASDKYLKLQTEAGFR